MHDVISSFKLLSWVYTCQLSCLRCELCLQVENFDLTPTHAYRPISHAKQKNLSCYTPTNALSNNCKLGELHSGPGMVNVGNTFGKHQTVLENLWMSLDNGQVVFKNPGSPRIKKKKMKKEENVLTSFIKRRKQYFLHQN